ncbi:MAG TPA: chloride channel protein [Polyangiaceae bacterium]|nr:chloride channel protein [Polyangiaceae bacterium]
MSPRIPDSSRRVPLAPSLGPALAGAHMSPPAATLNRRVVVVASLAVLVAVAAGFVAQALTRLIGLVTNLCFYGRVSTAFTSPAGNHLGWWVVLLPAAGGIVVGVMARFGSPAIRGHGIPEAMEQVLTNQSRIPARLTFLKPLSAAVSIGTGGPFGAEGPIIATGGALGSLLGQVLATTALERKTLLAAGAAAGMAATFGSPLSAVLLAVELLLFEYHPRSLIPVALASTIAAGVRLALVGGAPVFPMPDLSAPHGAALLAYIFIGALVGVVSVGVTRAVYAVEDRFERLPIHWMWWPALGGLPVGLIGYFAPHTLGVGYDNIEQIVSGSLAIEAVVVLCALKFVSWVIALGSGTSGGTLAPLFTVGGGLGAVLGTLANACDPALGVDVRIAALVGMAALFAGASRALLASVVFAFEATHAPFGVLPLLGGCTAAFLVSHLLMQNTIMTEKIARRGVRVIGEYGADFLDSILVRERGVRALVTVNADDDVRAVRTWLASDAASARHQGFPVIDASGELVGVITRRELLDDSVAAGRVRDLLRRPPIVVADDSTLRDAADRMAREGIGRLPVVSRKNPCVAIGIVTRSDLVNVHADRLREHERGVSRDS